MAFEDKRILLNVPYEEKDQAKDLGARWDSNIKRWYIDFDKDIKHFKKWLPDTSEQNILKDAPNKIANDKEIKAAPLQELDLVRYWHDGLVRSSFDGFGKLKSELEDIDQFTWENAKTALTTIKCKKIEGLASDAPVVRHLTMLLESERKGQAKSNIVIFTFPLEAKINTQVESEVNNLHYKWVRHKDEMPMFNHRLLGDEAEIEGLGLTNKDGLNNLLFHSQTSGFRSDAGLEECISFINLCFERSTENGDNCQEWIKRFDKNKQSFSVLRNKKVVLRLVDGNSASGATKNIRNCYSEVLRINNLSECSHQLFYNFTQIFKSIEPSAFAKKDEISTWKSLDIYLSHMDSRSDKVARSCYALDQSQRIALTVFKKLKNGGHLAVNGPPGTGKTSFLRAVIADQWVQPLLSDEAAPKCPIILAVAATNQAVTNIISSFDSVPGATLFDGNGDRNNNQVSIESRWIPYLDSYGWYHPASVNSKGNEYGSYQVISRKAASSTWRFYCAAEKFDSIEGNISFLESSYISAANEYFNEKDTLEGYSSRFRGKIKYIVENLRTIEQHLKDWVACNQKIIDSGWNKCVEEKYHELSKKISSWKGPNGVLYAIDTKIKEIENTIYHLRKNIFVANVLMSQSALYSVIRFVKKAIFHVDNKSAWKDLVFDLNRCGINVVIEDSGIEIILDKVKKGIAQLKAERNNLLADKVHIQKNINDFETQCKVLQNVKIMHTNAHKEEFELRKTLIDLIKMSLLKFDVRSIERHLISISERIDYYEQYQIDEAINDFYTIIQDNLDRAIRPEIFHISARFWEAQYILQKRNKTSRSEDSAKSLRDIAMLAPVFVTTCYSAPKLMRNASKNRKSDYMYGAADLLIVDEAGQSTPEIGCCSFLFAKKALIVGDVKQLPPVWSFSQPIDKLIHKKYKNIDDFDNLATQGALLSSGSIMHMAQYTSSYFDIDRKIKGVMLTSHYRCREPIINICNEMVYDGALHVVKPATEPKTEWDKPLGFLVVPGESTKLRGGSRCNYEEAALIARWIKEKSKSIMEHYSENGSSVDLSDCLAVLTPYKGQVKVLKDEISKIFFHQNSGNKNPAEDMIIGTVHSLQGSERPIVLFSMVDTYDPGGDHFYDTDTSLINVAVSRAKEIFIAAIDQKAVDYGRGLKTSNIKKPSDYLFSEIVKKGQRMNSRRLLIIESPNKISHITDALSQGLELEVLSTGGHLAKLDAGGDWNPLTAKYPKWSVLSESEQQLYQKTATLWPDLEAVYIATDPDCEGECIAWQYLERMKDFLPTSSDNKVDIKRMIFYGLTHKEIQHAYKNASYGLNAGMVKAALFRSLIDQIIARHYLNKINMGPPNAFSSGIGRVQLAILDIAKSFLDKDEKYIIEIHAKTDNDENIKFILCDCKTSKPIIIEDPIEAKNIVDEVLSLTQKKRITKLKYTNKLEQLNDYPAINTARMLSLSYREGNLNPNTTMRVLQNLYEGCLPVIEHQKDTEMIQ